MGDVLETGNLLCAVVAVVHLGLRAARARPAVVRLATIVGSLAALATILLASIE